MAGIPPARCRALCAGPPPGRLLRDRNLPPSAPPSPTGERRDHVADQRLPQALDRRWDPLVLTAFVLLAVLALGWWVLQGRPEPLPEVTQARLQCASYAPYRLPGETPYDPTARVSVERLREDLKTLSSLTSCVRTYSINQGLDQVPAVAAELGMQVMVGAWLGRDRAANEKELTQAIALSRQHPGTVRALIIGNEVLLRRELPEEELAAQLRRARAESAVPVTYADVWEFWVEHPKLVDEVSFVTIHVLPYWEDEPVGIGAAIDHVLAVTHRMQKLAGGKEVMIGETGWPSGGRQRREARPGRLEQATFVRQFALMAEREGLHYNLIEAFDQPWKRRLEGAMGGYWGLFDSAGTQKFPWTGPVEEIVDWQRGLYAALGFGLLFAAVGVKRRHGAFGTSVLALIGLATGAALAAQWRYMLAWNRDLLEWGTTAGFTCLTLLLILLAAERLAGRRNDALPSAAAVLADWRERGVKPKTDRVVVLLRLGLLFGAAIMMVLLVADARYRGFPTPLYVIPVALWLINWLMGERSPRRAQEESLLGLLIGFGAIWVIVAERPLNGQALVFCGLMLVLAGCATNFRYGLDWLGARQRANSPATSPKADKS